MEAPCLTPSSSLKLIEVKELLEIVNVAVDQERMLPVDVNRSYGDDDKYRAACRPRKRDRPYANLHDPIKGGHPRMPIRWLPLRLLRVPFARRPRSIGPAAHKA